VFGALFFGKLSDQLGHKNLFIVTLGVYLAGNAATALSWGNTSVAISFLFLTRFVAGMGIGGEYAAINSAIDEMMPARYRGRVDIAINGTYWGGAILGTLVQLLLLNTLDHSIAWRLGFLVGPAIGLCIWRVRKNLPESPRWLVIHGREDEAEDNIRIIEDEVRRSGQTLEDVPDERAIEIHPQPPVRFLHLAKVLFQQHRNRTILGSTLMITQSFLCNAIFFTYTLVLTKVYGISESWAPAFLIAFAVGNLVGPLTLGKLFDTVGRRKMIAGTYLLSGVLLAVSAAMFQAGWLNAYTQTLAWCIIDGPTTRCSPSATSSAPR
jgi:MFS family permease